MIQQTLSGYDAFVEKFKPRKTTDDCYTPPVIYETVLSWATHEYHLDGREVVRPFFPGGDYERYDYPDGCVVIDNPPFSIISKIARFYVDEGIDFFLFAPHLTNFSVRCANHVICGAHIIYENGANIPTSFVTSLGGDCAIRTAPDLYAALTAANKKTKKHVPKYEYPTEVLTVSMLEYLAKHGVSYAVGSEDCVLISRLEDQARCGKAIFGGGYLLSEKAAAEKAAAEKAAAEKAAAEKAAAEKAAAEKVYVWHLSDQERIATKSLGKH